MRFRERNVILPVFAPRFRVQLLRLQSQPIAIARLASARHDLPLHDVHTVLLERIGDVITRQRHRGTRARIERRARSGVFARVRGDEVIPDVRGRPIAIGFERSRRDVRAMTRVNFESRRGRRRARARAVAMRFLYAPKSTLGRHCAPLASSMRRKRRRKRACRMTHRAFRQQNSLAS